MSGEASQSGSSAGIVPSVHPPLFSPTRARSTPAWHEAAPQAALSPPLPSASSTGGASADADEHVVTSHPARIDHSADSQAALYSPLSPAGPRAPRTYPPAASPNPDDGAATPISATLTPTSAAPTKSSILGSSIAGRATSPTAPKLTLAGFDSEAAPHPTISALLAEASPSSSSSSSYPSPASPIFVEELLSVDPGPAPQAAAAQPARPPRSSLRFHSERVAHDSDSMRGHSAPQPWANHPINSSPSNPPPEPHSASSAYPVFTLTTSVVEDALETAQRGGAMLGGDAGPTRPKLSSAPSAASSSTATASGLGPGGSASTTTLTTGAPGTEVRSPQSSASSRGSGGASGASEGAPYAAAFSSAPAAAAASAPAAMTSFANGPTTSALPTSAAPGATAAAAARYSVSLLSDDLSALGVSQGSAGPSHAEALASPAQGSEGRRNSYGTVRSRSPSASSSHLGFFASLRPASPRFWERVVGGGSGAGAAGNAERDSSLAGFGQTAAERRKDFGWSGSGDRGSTGHLLSPSSGSASSPLGHATVGGAGTSAAAGGAAPAAPMSVSERPRRPSSVFDHVGGMLERIGKRVGRGERASAASSGGEATSAGSAAAANQRSHVEGATHHKRSLSATVGGGGAATGRGATTPPPPSQQSPLAQVHGFASHSTTALGAIMGAGAGLSLGASAAVAAATTMQPSVSPPSALTATTHSSPSTAPGGDSARTSSAGAGPGYSGTSLSRLASTSTSWASTSADEWGPSGNANGEHPGHLARAPGGGPSSPPQSPSGSAFGSGAHVGGRLQPTLPPTTSGQRRVSVLQRVLIQVTDDNERFSVVDVSGLSDAAAIKERMFSKLHLYDEDPANFALTQTEIGQLDPDAPRVDDDTLLALCMQYGDHKGTLKFLLQQIAPASEPSRVLAPPTAVASPRRALKELDAATNSPRMGGNAALPGEGALFGQPHAYDRSGASAPTAAAQAAPATPSAVRTPASASTSSRPSLGGNHFNHHAKSASISSKSSLSDALAHPDMLAGVGAYESGSEAGGSAAAGGGGAGGAGVRLHRSRVVHRRPMTSATSEDGGRSTPSQHFRSPRASGLFSPEESALPWSSPSAHRDEGGLIEEVVDEGRGSGGDRSALANPSSVRRPSSSHAAFRRTANHGSVPDVDAAATHGQGRVGSPGLSPTSVYSARFPQAQSSTPQRTAAGGTGVTPIASFGGYALDSHAPHGAASVPAVDTARSPKSRSLSQQSDGGASAGEAVAGSASSKSTIPASLLAGGRGLRYESAAQMYAPLSPELPHERHHSDTTPGAVGAESAALHAVKSMDDMRALGIQRPSMSGAVMRTAAGDGHGPPPGVPLYRQHPNPGDPAYMHGRAMEGRLSHASTTSSGRSSESAVGSVGGVGAAEAGAAASRTAASGARQASFEMPYQTSHIRQAHPRSSSFLDASRPSAAFLADLQARGAGVPPPAPQPHVHGSPAAAVYLDAAGQPHSMDRGRTPSFSAYYQQPAQAADPRAMLRHHSEVRFAPGYLPPGRGQGPVHGVPHPSHGILPGRTSPMPPPQPTQPPAGAMDAWSHASQQRIGGGHVNEFGARAHSGATGAGVAFGPRPHTFHEHAPVSAAVYYPQMPQQQQQHLPPHMTHPQRVVSSASVPARGAMGAPVTVPPALHREDPFTAMHFPNSSSRQVSEFQRTAVQGGPAALTPGKTVQETLHARGHSGPTVHATAPGQPLSFGPREPRGPMQPSHGHAPGATPHLSPPTVQRAQYHGTPDQLAAARAASATPGAMASPVRVSAPPPAPPPQPPAAFSPPFQGVPAPHSQQLGGQQHVHTHQPQPYYQVARSEGTPGPGLRVHAPTNAGTPSSMYRAQPAGVNGMPTPPQPPSSAPATSEVQQRAQQASAAAAASPMASQLSGQPRRPQTASSVQPPGYDSDWHAVVPQHPPHQRSSAGAAPLPPPQLQRPRHQQPAHVHDAAQQSERSSGSSYTSAGSGSQATGGVASAEESMSTPTSARSSRSDMAGGSGAGAKPNGSPVTAARGPLPDAPVPPSERLDMAAATPGTPSDAQRRRQFGGSEELGEDELLNLRPLPMPPSFNGGAATRSSEEDEGTLRAARLASLLAGNADGEGTIAASQQAHGLHVPLTAQHAGSSISSDASSSTVMPDSVRVSGAKAAATAAANATAGDGTLRIDDPDGGGTFASFASFDDDDDDDAATWAKPPEASASASTAADSRATSSQVAAASMLHSLRGGGDGPKTAATAETTPKGATSATLASPRVQESSQMSNAPPSPTSISAPPSALRPPSAHGAAPASPRGAASPRRPVLTLNIDGAAAGASNSNAKGAHGASAPSQAGAVDPTGAGPTTGGLSTPARPPGSGLSPGSGVARRTSFAAKKDTDWAPRPPPEQLYEHLDEFFPKHDLDKPVLIDTAPVLSSPLVEGAREDDDAAASGASGAAVPAGSTGESGARDGPTTSGKNASLAAPSIMARGRHKKSIRLVAQDRKRFLERVEQQQQRQQQQQQLGGALGGRGGANGSVAMSGSGAAAIAAAAGAAEDVAGAIGGSSDPAAQQALLLEQRRRIESGLARRRSTKLWGGKVVEMTPGQDPSTALASTPMSDSPSGEAGERPVFKWVKGDLIGKGTYGRVYLALNATTGEMIAVKQVELPRTASDQADGRQRSVVAALKSEIETLKDLDHAHIVSYLGFEETDQFLSIFLEYIPGGSIASVLRKYGKLDEATVKFFTNQILDGLSYLHQRGVLHRDLKGDNLLVTLEGVVKVTDFGTVRHSENIYSNIETMSVQGSVFWMAPEILNSRGYSAKVDIWSLGCVCLEMFAGRRPWSDADAVQAMFRIGAERRAPPVPADVRLSKAAAHFLRNCFEVEPDKRPTAAKLLTHVFPHSEPGWEFANSPLAKALTR